MLLLSGCAKEAEEQSHWDGPVLELNVACMEPSGLTKAGVNDVAAGENNYHENVISSVDFFFYPGDATSEPATYHVRYDNLSKRGNAVFRMELTTNQVNYQIFPAQAAITEATVFAIANIPDSLLGGLEDTSMDNIFRQVVTTDFVNSQYTNHRQEQFIMSGTSTITLTGRSQKLVAQGMVGLERYACKITVGIRMDDPMAVDTGRKDDQDNPIYEYWVPRPREMQIYLVDGMSKMDLSGVPAGKEWEPAAADYLSYRGNPMRFYNGSGDLYLDKDGEYYQTFPMYTYPYQWQPGSIEDGTREPYLKLVLPWDRQPDPEHNISAFQREFYYKILIPQDMRGEGYENSFVRNNWYHYNIGVGVLGSETDEAAVPLEASMFIVYWQDKDVVIKQVSIGNARYLSVEKEEYILNNQDGVDVRYTTSNPITIKDIHVTRPYYGENPSEGQIKYGATVRQVSHTDAIAYDDIYPDGSWYLEYSEAQRKALDPDGKDWLQDVDGVVRYTHKLNNDYQTDDFDYSPYTITFAVGHADNKEAWMMKYDKHVTIVQKPGLYIEALPNPDEITDKGNNSTTAHHGYVYVNREWYTQEQYFNEGSPADKLWRTISYNGGGTDMYKINTTVLAANSGFVIGDPRVATVKNPTRDYDLDVYGRTLTYYYPAEETERTRNMIAPSYRVSTKLSGAARSTEVTYEDAFDRCAALQENGFPAGRWRLPTEGEIRFISSLSSRGVFEWQFSGNYWSSNGGVSVNKSNGNVSSQPGLTTAYVRCVYDSWYWSDERVVNEETGMPDIFTWGDRER